MHGLNNIAVVVYYMHECVCGLLANLVLSMQQHRTLSISPRIDGGGQAAAHGGYSYRCRVLPFRNSVRKQIGEAVASGLWKEAKVSSVQARR
jgi:hypothetical protein